MPGRLRDTTVPLGGRPKGESPIFIPKGSEVAWNTYSMYRRKGLFGENADEFIPERWQDLKPTWEYLLFNGGPRTCLEREFSFLRLMCLYYFSPLPSYGLIW
jgi:cytochrome P450